MDIRPQDLPEIRSEVVAWHLSHGPAMFDVAIRMGRMPLRPEGATHAAAQHLAHAEAQRVMNAELFWVNADMTELATVAAKSMPSFTLSSEDLPSRWGLMIFERPIHYMKTDAGDVSPIVAAAWGPWAPPNWTTGGVWVSWYSDVDAAIERAEHGHIATQAGELAPWVAATIKAEISALVYDCETVAPFTDTAVATVDALSGDPAEPDALGVDLMKTVWLLMQQPLSRSTEVVPDRAVRKRLRRKQQEPAPVRVIELRRSPRSESDGTGTREYHHAWVVRGHWRQQWHPKREVHRPVWIAPHIKGPEGAPLIGGEKVYAWKR